MRKKFILFILLPGFVLLLTVYLFIDRWVESGLEYGGEKVVGAKVEIDNLVLTLSPVGVEFARLQVADPQDGMKNIFETGKVKFAFDGGQLLRSKFIIETMEVNNLILGTKRSSDGTLPERRADRLRAQRAPAPTTDSAAPVSQFAEQAAPVLQAKEEKRTPVFDLDRIRKEIKIDSLVSVKNLRSVQYYDSLKTEVQRASEQWQTALGEIDKSKPKIAEIEANVKAVNVSEIKSLESAKSALENVKKAYDNASEVSKSFNERKNALNDQVNRFSNAYFEAERLAKEDFQSVLSLARLPDVSMMGLAELVLGKELMQNVGKYLYWVDFARENVPVGGLAGKTEKEEPEHRFEGQNIHFPVERAYPKLWIKKILVSGGTDKAQDPQYFYLKGEVKDISSDQRITGHPFTLDLAGTKGGSTSLGFSASFDRRKELPVDDYHAKLAGFRVADMQVGKSDFLPSKITKAVAGANIDVNVPGNKFESTSKISFGNIAMVFESQPKNTVERIVKEVLASLTGFHVTLRLWNSDGKFDIGFSTDLDDQIASRTRKVIGDEVARIQNEIRSKVNARIAEKRKEFETLFNQKKEDVTSRLKGYESQMNERLAMVEGKKKEVENKIDEETKKQTEGVKKKAEETIKGLFKKN